MKIVKISIGMLAYNEEDVILNTLNDVLNQNIFTHPSFDVQFLVIANGCTDNTASIAEEAFNEFKIKQLNTTYKLEVCDITTAGKSNAWNEYVHEKSCQDSDYLILIDADIELYDKNSLKNLVQQLINIPKATVSIDIPRKDIEKKCKKSIFEKLSLQLSKVDTEKRTSITGQLYCIRGIEARQIYVPLGLPVEDGFLAAMIQTDKFTQVGGGTKITLAESVSHYFHALISPAQLIKHEKRLMIGSAINAVIYNYLWSHVARDELHAGILIRDLNSSQPNWLEELVEQYKYVRGFWFVPKELCLKHFKNWNKSTGSFSKKLTKLPVVLIATFALICLAINVNFYFKTKNGIGHW